MQSISEYYYINEAWANVKNYKNELQDLLDKMNKKRNALEKHNASKRTHYRQRNDPKEVLAKYPMQIIVDKLGYEPKKMMKTTYGPKGHKDKEVINLSAYGYFLANKIEKEEVSLNDLIKWWEEYDNEILNKNWHDPKWLVKQIDPIKLWDPYHPKSNYKIDKLFENPVEILSKLKSESKYWRLSKEEREDLNNFYADPVNKDVIIKALKGQRKEIEKFRPQFSESVSKWLEEIFDNVDVNGKSLHSLLEKEYAESNKPYYQGNNYRDEYAHAVLSIIYKSLNEIYGISFSRTSVKDEDNPDYYKIKYTGSGKDADLEKFVDDAESIEIYVDDDGKSKTEQSDVHNSSFFTFYKHDFTVTIKTKSKEDYVKEYKNITVASDYFSGGW